MRDDTVSVEPRPHGIPLHRIFVLLVFMAAAFFGLTVVSLVSGIEGRFLIVASFIVVGFLILVAFVIVAQSIRIDRERQQAWRVLKESEARHKAMLDSAPNPIVIYDSEGLALYVNPAFTRVFGWSIGELIGRRIDFVPDDQREITVQAIRNVYAHTDRVCRFDTQRFTQRGDRLDISITAAVFLDNDGNAQGMAVNLEDITERRKTEEALRATEAQYRLLAASITDVIWTMGLDMRFTYVSPATEKLQGWPVADILTMGAADIMTPESLERVMAAFAAELTAAEASGDYNRSMTIELDLLRREGGTVPAEVTAAFVVGTDGQPTGVSGVTRDITERRRSQAEKEALQEQLSRLKKMEALGLLAGGVAHDLNNVLSGIVSYPDLILMDLPPDSPFRRPVETMKSSGQKAATIVQDLLTLARRGVVTTEIVNLNEVLDDYLSSPEHSRLMADHPAVRVETVYEPTLPNVEGSTVHLRKSVMNLVANAAEALTLGGALRIRTESRFLDHPLKGYARVETGEYVVLQVADDGQGISDEDLPHIFEPFYTRKVMGRSGTGLGMAVVWGTVQDHHGYIDVRSTVGVGTVFELYFPMSRKARPEAVLPVDLETLRGSGETILVVDDAPSQREIASRMLEVLGYTVVSADSGEAAVAYLNAHPVDLIILDMIMAPGIDGLETYRRVIETHPAQRAVIASGFAETDRVRAAQHIGAGEYIKKPYSLERLALAVHRALHPGD
ncbi:MAG: PAS domain S-box protein [Pseudomonadota bacterium]